MRAAILSAMGERVFEKGEQRLGGQFVLKQPRYMAQKTAWRRKVKRGAGAVIRFDIPPVQRGGNLPGQHPVGRDQRRRLSVFGGLTQARGDDQRLFTNRRGLDQRNLGRGVVKSGQGRAFAQPLIGDGSRAQRQRNQPVARRAGRRGHVPGGDLGWRQPQLLHEFIKPVLRVILCGQGITQMVPDRGGHVEIEPRKHNRALWQPGDGLHQQHRRAARPGGSGQDHRVFGRRLCPAVNQMLDDAPLAALGIGGLLRIVQEMAHNAQKRLGACPVAGLVGHIQRLDGIERHAFALHFVHQAGQAVGKVID